MWLISKLCTGLISWVPNSQFMTVSLHVTLPSTPIVDHIGKSFQSRHLQMDLQVTIAWPPYLMSSTSSAPEAQEECSAPCIHSQSLQFKKGALLLLQRNSQIVAISNFLYCHYLKGSLKGRSHLLISAPPVSLSHWNHSAMLGIPWFWKIKLLDGTSNCSVGVLISKDELQWHLWRISSWWRLQSHAKMFQ